MNYFFRRKGINQTGCSLYGKYKYEDDKIVDSVLEGFQIAA